ncbi:sulfotransferase [Bradyrhizobium sp.]|uniref:tetratricopeptide repeat-containing sulfotransferase family protein n=1 Tax=Bradyrhizobium sp. TaxID=376 RepID=UPI001EB9CB2B|nr:sulfotransferase [Bradyrhizobium sp.]MBV9980929.1 sulfotransferase [Bradyrhizobium sp.]
MRTTVPHRQPPGIDAARRAFGAGDIAATERICAEILADSADDWAAWCLLTETALRRGRYDAAIVCAGRAVRLAPRQAMPLILRAKCLFLSGDSREALSATEAAAKHVGAAPDALDALGAMFGLLGLHRRAGEFFVRAVELCPDVPQYLFNLAATERMIGALGDAETHCDAAIARDPHYALAHYLRSDLRVQSADRNHVEEMEALIRDAKLARPSEILLRFALGKECEDLELWERAFAHVQAGCDLQLHLMAPDRPNMAAEIDRIIRLHTRDWIASAPSGHAAAAPVFVTGLPRTGTTLVERIIASHPAMSSVGETGAFASELARAIAGQAGAADPARLGKRYIDAAAFRLPPNARFLDKTLENYLHCGLIHVALPAAKIILVQRHPLDAGWAIYKAHFQGKFPFAYDQVELADTILAYRRLSQHWQATLPPHALMIVNYEDIVREPETSSRTIIDFLGLPWADEVLRFHESPAPSATASAVQVRRPIYTSSLGRWRHHAKNLAPLRTRLAHEIPESELV